MKVGEYNQQPLRIENNKTVANSIENSKHQMNAVNEKMTFFYMFTKLVPVTDIESNQNVVEAISHTFP